MATPVHQRMQHFHTVALPTVQQLNDELAQACCPLQIYPQFTLRRSSTSALGFRETRWLSMSVLSSGTKSSIRVAFSIRWLALKFPLVFTRLQDSKAEALVRKCLDEEPTPKLWCGNIVMARAPLVCSRMQVCFGRHYKQRRLLLQGLGALWKPACLSRPCVPCSFEPRFPRAMRSLGRKYLMLAEQQFKLNEKDAAQESYKKSVDYFSKSLAINAFQPDAWFSLGCAANSCADYPTAVRAFRRKVDLDPEVGLWRIVVLPMTGAGLSVVEQPRQCAHQAQGEGQGVLCPSCLLCTSHCSSA